MIYVLTKSAKPFSRYEAINFKFPREEQNIVFLNVSIKMENNRIRDVIVDYFIMKKEIICHISVIWDTEVMTLFKQSVRHIGNAITRLSWLSWQPNWNKTSLIENRWHSCDELLVWGQSVLSV